MKISFSIILSLFSLFRLYFVSNQKCFVSNKIYRRNNGKSLSNTPAIPWHRRESRSASPVTSHSPSNSNIITPLNASMTTAMTTMNQNTSTKSRSRSISPSPTRSSSKTGKDLIDTSRSSGPSRLRSGSYSRDER